jgi:hypothetical protein
MEGHHHVLLPTEITKLDPGLSLTLHRHQLEVRRHIPYSQCHVQSSYENDNRKHHRGAAISLKRY